MDQLDEGKDLTKSFRPSEDARATKSCVIRRLAAELAFSTLRWLLVLRFLLHWLITSFSTSQNGRRQSEVLCSAKDWEPISLLCFCTPPASELLSLRELSDTGASETEGPPGGTSGSKGDCCWSWWLEAEEPGGGLLQRTC